jgi:4-hydroxybenzoate polyprenyltransferase
LKRVQALIITSHPVPSLVITALATLLAVQAAPHGIGPALTGPALLAGQLSIGWSNDACDAARDAAAGRTDKPLARGDISAAAVWTAAGTAAGAGLVMALVIGPVTGGLYALVVAPGWAYNLGLKSSLASGVMYLLGFGPLPAYAASTLPGHPAPRWPVTVAAGLLGLGAHFANVLPDLAADKATGVGGLPQRVAARQHTGGQQQRLARGDAARYRHHEFLRRDGDPAVVDELLKAAAREPECRVPDADRVAVREGLRGSPAAVDEGAVLAV